MIHLRQFFSILGLSLCLAMSFSAPVSVAAEPEGYGKTISSIQVNGLKRIELDAVIEKLSSKKGETLSSEKVRTDIQKLFQMGYFDDIAFFSEVVSGQVVVKIKVKERPAISEIEFDGNERVSTNDLKEVIKVKEWSILDINKVKEDTALIQKHYEDKGFFLAKVSYEIHSGKEGEVKLTYKITDYEKVQIKKITFLNNKRFNDEQLKNVFQETREGGIFSFMSGSGNFKESGFKQDLQRLTYWYLDNGYLKFKYENPVITMSDDKRWLYLTIFLDEGDMYDIGQIDFSGDLLFTKEQLNEPLTLLTGERFAITKRNADIQKLSEMYQDLGYAFVNVIPKMNIHDDTKTVDIDYAFEKGNLVYFGEITVAGNSKTYDKVIRRELKIQEGELYNGTRFRQSKENVERLGYFAPGEVIFNTSTPQGRPNVMNVEIQVKERSTGTITVGAGYGSVQGFFLTGTLQEINFLGKGQNLGFSAQYSTDQIQRSFNLSFTDPYAFDTKWSIGGDLYSTIFLIPNKYITRRLGFNFRLGHPLAEYVMGYITYKNEGLQLTDIDAGIPRDQIEADSGVLSSVIFRVERDKRNNRFETSSGNLQSIQMEFAGLGGDKKFIKWNANNRVYFRLVGDLIFRNSTEVGQITSWGGDLIPPAEKFYLGGPNNMRGFDLFLLGPKRYNSRGRLEPLGGSYEFFSLVELEHPLIREAGLKWVVFTGIGNAWDKEPWREDVFVVRAEYGFGFRWFSPIGPLRFEWGFPIAKRDEEDSPVFNFFIGTPF